MKRKILLMLFAAMLAFCSLNVFAASTDPCDTEDPDPSPEPEPTDSMPIKLGE